MGEFSITQVCRELRKNETPEEKLVWNALKSRKFFGEKFRRQHPFIYESIQGKKRFFVADFYCAAHNLVIELDGRIHDFQKDYDKNRDEVLAQLGLKTIRIKNEELYPTLNGVLDKIKTELDFPSPRSVEGVERSETGEQQREATQIENVFLNADVVSV